MEKNKILLLALTSLFISSNDSIKNLTKEETTPEIEAEALKKREEKLASVKFIEAILASRGPVQRTKRLKITEYKQPLSTERSGFPRLASDELLRKVLIKNAERAQKEIEQKEIEQIKKLERAKLILFNNFKQLETSSIEEVLKILYPENKSLEQIKTVTTNLKKLINSDNFLSETLEHQKTRALILLITIKRLEKDRTTLDINPKTIFDILKEIKSE